MKNYLFIYRDVNNNEIARAVRSFHSISDARLFALKELASSSIDGLHTVWVSVARGPLYSFPH